MQNFAEEMSKSTLFSKDMVMSLEAQATNMSKSEEQAKKLTRAAIELSAATGRDAHSSMQMLTMSLNGMTRGLDRIVPGMKNLTQAELEAGAAADMIIKRFGGSAQEVTQTFGGRVTKLKTSFEELHESIGKAITQSPFINRALEGITKLIDQVTSRIDEWVKGGGIEEILKSLINLANGINTYVIAPLELTYNIGKALFDSMVAGTAWVIASFAKLGEQIVYLVLNPLQFTLNKAAEVIGVFSSDMEEKIKNSVNSIADAVKENSTGIKDALVDTAVEASMKANESFSKIGDFSFSANLANKIEEIKVFMDGAKAPVDGLREGLEKLNESTLSVTSAFSLMGAGLKSAVNDLVKTAKKDFEDLGKTMFRSMGSGAANAFAAFGKAIATGKDGLKAFTDSVLSTLGSMAVQTGTQMILTGAAYTWAGMANGPGLMAAGAALSAFGGLLSGLGGGGESSAGAAAGGAGGGGGATNAASPLETPAQSAEPVMEKKAAIIINGDFLNSRETANHLAEVLRQNSDITDYTITAQGRSYI